MTDTPNCPLPTAHSPAAKPRALTLTASGRMVDLLDLKPEDVEWPAIARQLARIPRFLGATREPYSVAQHSVHVARRARVAAYGCRALSPRSVVLYALLHDAPEAYYGDITRPCRVALEAIAIMQSRTDGDRRVEIIRSVLAGLDWSLAAAIHRRAALPPVPPPSIAANVRTADDRMLATELRDLMPAGAAQHEHLAEPYPEPITEVWPAERAEREFLAALAAHGID